MFILYNIPEGKDVITRHLSEKLLESAQKYPVVSLTGPRQSGKTTLVRSVFTGHAYISLESPDHLAFALEDPRGFLGQFSGNVILDEAQRTPDLFSYIQTLVDEEDRPGRFVLTGSHNFLLMEKISQSLAGRSAILHLLPFSHSELVGRAPMPIESIGMIEKTGAANSKEPAAKVFDLLLRGFYPRIHDKNLDSREWLGNYCQTYLERDVRELVEVGNLESFTRFLRLCAGRSGQLLNVASLAADAGISHSTARRWLSILEASFIVYLLQPHHANFNKRLVKSPKLYFFDTGLLCFLLKIRSAEELLVHSARGAVFETWAISEILKNYYHRGRAPEVHFWRDSLGREIDLLIEDGRRLIPVEIKSGETVADDFFRTLDFWRRLPGQENSPAALIYAGENTYLRNQVAVYSWRDWG
jgi:uncharacterized protein